MDRLPMCRICLAENVRLCTVANRNLHKLYETLTNIPFVTDDSSPMLACVFCFAKLKQCYKLLRQCLKAEELYDQKINDKNELNPVVNEKHFVIFGGLIKSRVEQTNVVDCIAVGEELSAVREGPDDVIEPKEEHQNDELKPENLDSSCLDVADIPPYCSESVLDDAPLRICKFEVKDEEVFEVEDKKNRSATKTIKLEPENLDSSCLDVANIPPHCSESVLNDVPLMICKFEVKDEEVFEVEDKINRRATETIKLEPENLDSSCLDVADIPPHCSESVLNDVPLMICKFEVKDEEVFEEEDKKNRRATETIKLEPENLDSSCLDVADIPPHCSESVLNDVPLMICKFEGKDEEVFEVEDKKNRRATETIKLEPKNLDNGCLDEADISLHCYESYLEDDIPLMKCKTEVEDEKVSKKKRKVTATIKQEPENLDNNCLNAADKPPHYYGSDLQDDVPLKNFKTEVDDEQVSKKKRRSTETIKLEPKNLDNVSLDAADISLHCYESYLEDDIPLMKCKTEVEDEKVSKKKRKVMETIKQEPEDNSCLNVADKPPHYYGSDLEDGVPLKNFKTEVDDENVSKNKRRSTETIKLEPKNLDNVCLDAADISLHCYESYLEDDIPLMKCKTEVEDEKVSKKKRKVMETIKQEPENLDNNCLNAADKPPHYYGSDLQDDVPLKNFKTEVDDEQVSKKKRRSTDTIKLEPKNLDNVSLDAADISLHCYESYLEDDIPLMKCKTEVEDEKVSKKKRKVMETIKQEPEDNSCLNVADKPPHYYGSDLQDDVPLKNFKTEVDDEQVSKKKRRSTETIKATVVRDPKPDTRRTKEKGAITADQTTNDKSDSKVFRTTQEWTSKPGPYFKEPYICNQSSSTNVKKEYKCHICQRVYSQRQRLTVHIRTHTGENPFKCDVCQRIFYQKYILKKHIHTHTGEKPYKCVVCPRSFTRESNLTMHMRIHTGVKPYTCHICKKNFSQRSHLKSHIRTHTGEKPYKCDICQRNFSRNGSLTVHMRTHTGEKPFKCNVCTSNFSIESNLTRHMRTHCLSA